MKTENYEVIFAIVNSGFADEAMAIAREHGARGGTILNARGVAREDEAVFFGITIHAEKEILMLVVEKAIRDDILDIEHLALKLVHRLRDMYPAELAARYKLNDADGWQALSDQDLVTLIGKKRGCLIPGGIVDNERVSNLLIDEFRAGKIGRLTIDRLPLVKLDMITPKKDTSLSDTPVKTQNLEGDDHAEL